MAVGLQGLSGKDIVPEFRGSGDDIADSEDIPGCGFDDEVKGCGYDNYPEALLPEPSDKIPALPVGQRGDVGSDHFFHEFPDPGTGPAFDGREHMAVEGPDVQCAVPELLFEYRLVLPEILRNKSVTVETVQTGGHAVSVEKRAVHVKYCQSDP